MNNRQCKECQHLINVKPLTDCARYPGRYPGPQSVITDCEDFEASPTIRDIKIIMENDNETRS